MRTTIRATATSSALTGPLLAAGCLRDAPPPGYTAVSTGAAGEWVDLSHAFGPSNHLPAHRHGRLPAHRTGVRPHERRVLPRVLRLLVGRTRRHHIDAPIHFAEGRRTADEIPLSSLITTASVVDVSAQAVADPDYQLTVGDLTGPEAVPELHFPGIGPEAAQWLVDNTEDTARRQTMAFVLPGGFVRPCQSNSQRSMASGGRRLRDSVPSGLAEVAVQPGPGIRGSFSV